MSPCPTDGVIRPTAHEQITADFLFRGSGGGPWNCSMQFQQNDPDSDADTYALACFRIIEVEPANSAGVIARDDGDGYAGSCAKHGDPSRAKKSR
jgi:hypothetical protein